MPVQLPIIHWNDVYRVRPQKISPKSSETIDVTQFSALLDDIRIRWLERQDGNREGLSLFSGDVFSPSVESTVTRGSHLVPVMNVLAPDVALLGNHDFDFGTRYPHLCKLMKDTRFPWLLSNVIDNTTGTVPDQVSQYQVLERKGVRIGIVGLIEEEWIGTISSWPQTFEYRDMADTGIELSKLLRDPQGDHRCDIVIALTHARCVDIKLAKALLALTPAAQKHKNISRSHGVDIILGGHDHLYFVGRGVDSWDGYDLNDEILGAEEDSGDVMIVKSGTDFRDLSEFILELEDAPEGSVRRKVIRRITGKHHEIKPNMRSNAELQKIIDSLLQSVGSALKAPLCKLDTELDLRSQYIRTQETASANWFADILLHTYDDALCMKGIQRGADGVLICAGMLRGDSIYGPGEACHLTLGDILEILPFEDPLVVLELDGKTLWDALEASVSTWPAQEGRFPVISGFRVSWDSRKPRGQRILGIWLRESKDDASDVSSESTMPEIVDGEEIRCERGKKYRIVTREYMALGHDGFEALKGQNYLVDHEAGQITSSVVRKYLLGARFVNKLSAAETSQAHLDDMTHDIIARARTSRSKLDRLRASQRWFDAVEAVKTRLRSRRHYRDHINVSAKEHMSLVDCFDGAKARNMPIDRHRDDRGRGDQDEEDEEDEDGEDAGDLLVVHPVMDGRLKDEGRV
ncbi:Metallo-dependent phosphatase [Vararia minispora EC-137]|uniref:Metallo-dependent phosphatase n=1 Tax=Vararia minispora EC-137 TaxID=1314806 RepID=A0ACB8QJA3_9AGAM|nr:Metallo-dependent phosphatase [Vararia minispora EC-137]